MLLMPNHQLHVFHSSGRWKRLTLTSSLPGAWDCFPKVLGMWTDFFHSETSHKGPWYHPFRIVIECASCFSSEKSCLFTATSWSSGFACFVNFVLRSWFNIGQVTMKGVGFLSLQLDMRWLITYFDSLNINSRWTRLVSGREWSPTDTSTIRLMSGGSISQPKPATTIICRGYQKPTNSQYP